MGGESIAGWILQIDILHFAFVVGSWELLIESGPWNCEPHHRGVSGRSKQCRMQPTEHSERAGGWEGG